MSRRLVKLSQFLEYIMFDAIYELSFKRGFILYFGKQEDLSIGSSFGSLPHR